MLSLPSENKSPREDVYYKSNSMQAYQLLWELQALLVVQQSIGLPLGL
jgi:hypothetical protein